MQAIEPNALTLSALGWAGLPRVKLWLGKRHRAMPEGNPVLVLGSVLEAVGRIQEDFRWSAAFLLGFFNIDQSAGEENLVYDFL